MSSLDPNLIGWWEFQSLEMAPIRTLGLIGGLAGRVCFSESGHYRTAPEYDDIERYSCVVGRPYSELNIWIRGHEKFPSLCIYAIEEDVLKITVAGRPVGADHQTIRRPFAMRMDGELNWALVTMKRSDPPRRRLSSVRKRVKDALEGAQLIPTTKRSVSLAGYLSGKAKAATGKTKDWLPFCTLEIPTGSLWAGDPLLANAEDGYVVKVPRGRYVVEGIGLAWGQDRIVSRLRVRLEGAEDLRLGKHLGDTGTDSAMIAVCDIKAFDKACSSDSRDEVQDAIESKTSDGFGIIAIENFPGAVMPFVPIGSDGSGPVFALLSYGKCVGVELPFMDESDPA